MGSGSSHPETKPWIAMCVVVSGVRRILDVGAGGGFYARELAASGWLGHIEALEVWRPNIEQYRLHELYDVVHEADARDWTDFAYDLVIFGDVLEHMPREDAVALWDRARHQARHAVIAIPIVPMPQEAIDGNPHEVHVTDDWSVEAVLATFPGIVAYFAGEVTGAFWATFPLPADG